MSVCTDSSACMTYVSLAIIHHVQFMQLCCMAILCCLRICWQLSCHEANMFKIDMFTLGHHKTFLFLMLYMCLHCLLLITQVSYTASSSLFGEDKFSYPRFYRLVPVTEQVADEYMAVVKRLRWRRVAVVSHGSELFLSVRYSYKVCTYHHNIHSI